jgi:hypothetical protein
VRKPTFHGHQIGIIFRLVEAEGATVDLLQQRGGREREKRKKDRKKETICIQSERGIRAFSPYSLFTVVNAVFACFSRCYDKYLSDNSYFHSFF